MLEGVVVLIIVGGRRDGYDFEEVGNGIGFLDGVVG